MLHRIPTLGALEGFQGLHEAGSGEFLNFPPAGFGVGVGAIVCFVESLHDELAASEFQDQAL